MSKAQAEKFKETGNEFFKKGRYEQAAEFYTKAIGTHAPFKLSSHSCVAVLC